MKHVSILVPEGQYSLVNVEGTFQILGWVNNFLTSQNKPPAFALHLVGLSKKSLQSNALFAVYPQLTIDAVPHTDLIIIPALQAPHEENMQLNSAFLPWLIKQYKSGAELVSYCIGAFFLAETGLLDGRTCATHWQYATQFRQLFPKALLQDDKIMTACDGIYTSGGAFSFTNLLLYLIEKTAGRDVAIHAAKIFMIDIDRASQSPFAIFMGQKSHGDEAVLAAQQIIEQQHTEKLSVDALSAQLGVGRRSFERRFKKATANTIAEYMQRVKIEAAKKGLERGRKTVNEVMYETGYNDPKAFREIFKRFTGLSPIEYRNKYNTDTVQARSVV